MSTHVKFDFAADLVAVHRVITRALSIATDRGALVLENSAAGITEFDGYMQYVECIPRILHEHHSNEDTVAFPQLRSLVPDAPYDLLMSQHAEMIHGVEQTESTIAALKKGTHDADTKDKLLENLQSLRTQWSDHIAIEEAQFGPDGISPTISMADRVRIGKASSRYAQLHSNPVPLMLPFLLYNLQEQDRAAMAQTIPGFLTRFFVPVLWRKRWEPMRPYLLI